MGNSPSGLTVEQALDMFPRVELVKMVLKQPGKMSRNGSKGVQRIKKHLSRKSTKISEKSNSP